MHPPSTKQIAIVIFETDSHNADMLRALGHPVPRVVRYQVTIDPDRLSPSQELIRFGQWGNDEGGAGDEITGWQPLNDIWIEEVLAEWDGQGFRLVEPTNAAIAA